MALFCATGDTLSAGKRKGARGKFIEHCVMMLVIEKFRASLKSLREVEGMMF